MCLSELNALTDQKCVNRLVDGSKEWMEHIFLECYYKFALNSIYEF
jgi:hypothetical protein